MASASGAGAKKPPEDVYADLFQTGMLSDVTIHYGQGHTFKVHSEILSPKSTWFANTHNGCTDIIEEGPPPKALQLFDHHQLVACSRENHEAARSCLPATLFKRLLRCCYLDKYPPVPDKEDLTNLHDIRVLCIRHMYMYFIAKLYGVSAILPKCAAKFAPAAGALRRLHKDLLVKFINAIYELPGLDESDLLRAEARRQAKLIADSTTVDVSQEIVRKELQKELGRMMPKVGADLFTHGYEPRSPTALSLRQNTCSRCLKPLAPERVSRLCTVCSRVSTQHISVEAPITFSTGLNICLWQCQGCSSIWHSETQRTEVLELKECQMCVPQGKKRKKAGVKGAAVWVCRGCRTVWKHQGTTQRKDVTMDACVCCV